MKKLAIARLGRSVGLKGEMRFFNLCDFPEQFKAGAVFESDRGQITIERVNFDRGTIKLEGVDTPEEAKKFTNAYLYSDESKTKEQIELGKDEYFWFDIIGLNLFEKGELLGKVIDIDRLPAADYLVVATDEALQKQNLPKRFLVPFLDKFVKNVDLEKKTIEADGAKEILEAS